ncbi:MAG: fibronectin type III domain-containing protein [Marinifilaceae bacterium]
MRERLLFALMVIGAIGVMWGCSKDDETPEEPVVLNPSEFVISVSELGFDDAEIKWSQSTIDDDSKIVYDVYLNEELKGKEQEKLSYQFQQLKYKTQYQVKVIAKSKYKTQTVVENSFTTKDAPLPAAVAIKVDKILAQEVEISWTPSDSDQKLKYDVYLDDVLKSEKQEELTFRFTELEAKSDYKIKLVVWNEYNKSVTVESTVSTMDHPTPKDFTLSVAQVGIDNAKVVWTNTSDQELTYRVLLNGVEKASSIKDLEYTFTSLSMASKYAVRIDAVNQYGKTLTKEAEFTTLDAEGPADFQIFAEQITSSSALIRWATTGDKNEELTYRVFMNGYYQGMALKDNSIQLKGLKAGSVQQVKIEVKNSHQKTLEKTYEFSTLPAPKLTDFTVSVEELKPNSAMLTWTKSTATDGSQVTYDVYYSSGSIAKRGLVDTHFALVNLKPGTDYEYKVEAKSEESVLFLSKSVSFSTPDFEAPGNFEVTVSDVTQTQAKLSWTSSQLPSGGEVSYKVYVGGNLYAQDLKVNEYVVSNLQPSVEYPVKVVAVSENNTTNVQSTSFKTLDAPAPEVVINVTYTDTQRIDVSYHVTGTVRYDSYELFLNGKSIYKGLTLGYNLKNLMADTDYRIKVVASKDGKSYEKEITARTKAFPVMLDFDLNVKTKTYKEVEVDWADFLNKNREVYPGYRLMTYEIYLNGVKEDLGKDVASKVWANLSEQTTYQYRLEVKYPDGSVAVDKSSEFTTPANQAPVWTGDLAVEKVGFGYVELNSVFAQDADEDGITYTYYVNGKVLDRSLGYIGNSRGDGQVVRDVNSNGNTILLSHLVSNKEYSLYIEARDPLGKIAKSNTVNFKTTIDAPEKFGVMAAVDPTVNSVGPRWKKIGNLASVKQVRIKWVVDGQEHESYHGTADKIIDMGEDDSLLLDYSPFLKDNPNAKISFSFVIEWIDQEPLDRSESTVIDIQ